MNAHGSPIQSRAAAKVACRPIDASDVPAIVDLLIEGFPERDRGYWERGLERLACRPAVGKFPRFGYLLAVDGAVVGCLLLIVSQNECGVPRGNVSSWYVQPAYRSLASMLVSYVFRHKDLTLINISPAPHTIPILEAQGYRRYVDGQIVAVPLLSAAAFGARVVVVGADENASGLLPEHERALLARHASWGCLSFVCRGKDDAEPFVFARSRPLRGILPAAQLVWCREIASVARFSGAIGRHLIRHGFPVAFIDATGPLAGLPGPYRGDRARKFWRGPHKPRLGDLADTELVVFGA